MFKWGDKMYNAFFDMDRDRKMKKAFLDISKRGVIKKYPKNSIIEIQDKKFYIVTKGRICYSFYSIDGGEKIFYFISAGGVFGELEYFEECKSELVVKSAKDSEISVLDEEQLEKIILESPEIYRYIIYNLIRKLRILMSVMVNMAFGDSNGKVADTLIRWFYQEGSIDKQSAKIRRRFTHEEISKILGCSRATVTKALNEFQDKELISINGDQIVIQDIEGLSKYVTWK
ncbi:cAMP-binding domain of CRP or a regulatory subunit of cAMP-dependent protein kinases [Tissierella praeacuta DSM 18095]|uniref:cAMP-binding domain of CRP or a regulatory subunit of cAMP-dependent protein kinases n=2 Tax=Tissierella praeacuta TaxID=43131 RepID=A0A1M4ZKC7_9FIRM|nr:cAMP-binding domain of CRP or a regulatory subunit of cAMP-dependent protein kinases [Tissierella praeacuta DSM 18095]SUP00683.1 cAMP regulatory protein [Tissierella praeacuta]